jgi:hypothetical protein
MTKTGLRVSKFFIIAHRFQSAPELVYPVRSVGQVVGLGR